MLGFMGLYDAQNPTEENINEGANLYLHGYVSSRLMRMGKKASEEGEGSDGEEGLPMTVAASCLDGLILALTPNNHSEFCIFCVCEKGLGFFGESHEGGLWRWRVF